MLRRHAGGDSGLERCAPGTRRSPAKSRSRCPPQSHLSHKHLLPHPACPWLLPARASPAPPHAPPTCASCTTSCSSRMETTSACVHSTPARHPNSSSAPAMRRRCRHALVPARPSRVLGGQGQAGRRSGTAGHSDAAQPPVCSHLSRLPNLPQPLHSFTNSAAAAQTCAPASPRSMSTDAPSMPRWPVVTDRKMAAGRMKARRVEAVEPASRGLGAGLLVTNQACCRVVRAATNYSNFSGSGAARRTPALVLWIADG